MSGTTKGLQVNRLQLIDQLEKAVQILWERHQQALRTLRAECNENRTVLIQTLNTRLSAVVNGAKDPGEPYYRGGLSIDYDTASKPVIRTYERDLEDLNRALRILRMSNQETVSMGPQMLRDLNLTRWL